ncbi:hypothetical protein FIV42_10945 [Persicimonas caeni]|uniref:Protein kinase domain-containing protein n=1 Tax=Persicimonas caeni TaxID=2292766 RepID=A0A4Y6PT81_PERCE|nr:serine/threonine-protein kinase [Persicimonas caeni]QDG51237.1 hypothetical protein FIV42_10945 [Persicimonas caeni]QED32458.1 protein kinase [Persicimonas caeni]
MATATKQRVLRSGVVIAEKYRVDKAIARGGFSVIYQGTHIGMERPVALKLLALDDEIKPTWLERFTREAKLASQLTHPNTVTIFDYGQDERGFLYIVMEWVEGTSLYHHLKKNGALSAPDVAEITLQILQSLDEAHRRGFLHRDLKPSNIMLSKDYEGQDIVKVLDFGIAKVLESSQQKVGRQAARITHKGAFIGTPRYASPEQLDGKSLTPAADIYSLGLLMWEALVGDPAVPSIQYGECVKYHMGDNPWRLPASVECPPGLANILYRALEKDLSRRYQTCREMHRDLSAWLRSSEAQRNSGQDFFIGATAAGGYEPVGLARESSDVDDDELFAGLVEQSSPGDQAPLDLHGPSGAPPPLSGSNEVSSAPGDDTFERELLALAEESSVPEMDQSAAPDTSPMQNPPRPVGAHARSEPRHPSRVSQKASLPASDGGNHSKKMTVAVSALAAAIILGAGAYAIFSGDETADGAADNANNEAVVAKEDDEAAEPPVEQKSPEQLEAELDDGTPSYSSGMIWTALNQSGWRRIGKVDTLEFSDLTQSSARFRKKSKTVMVTIYEAQTYADAESYVTTAEKPVQAMRFGKTTVQVSPGAKGNSTRGVYDLMSTLFQLKSIAQEQQ